MCCMELKIRKYDLEAIKSIFSDIDSLRVTGSALKGARAMGFNRQDIVDAIQALERDDFVKSMTTYNDHKVWQDVYNLSFRGFVIYIKFQLDDQGHFVISFKEK